MGKFQFSSLSKQGRIHRHKIEEVANAEGNPFEVVSFANKIDRDGEIYCWIEGRDKKWFASVISNIIKAIPADKPRPSNGPNDQLAKMEKAYREDMERRGEKVPGWESVLDVFTHNDTDPVVISYSVSGHFPSAEFAPSDWRRDLKRDARWDAFDELPAAEQWELAMPQLRSKYPERRIIPQAEIVATFIAEAVMMGVDPHEMFRGALIDMATDAPEQAERTAAFAYLSDEDKATFEKAFKKKR
ncbi:hypothetical protein G6L37_07475 [Agrobacterium rubi]|nr:hypothetical protein [Agrobacterium rubi]NTF25208.1 hypothetical protein [Agrobacterium rubi]